MYLCSLAPRAQGATGAIDAELRIAAFVPDPQCDLAEVDAVISTLELPDKGIATLDIKQGKGGQPRRLVMSTTQTLQMFFRTQRQSVSQEDIDEVLRTVAQAEMSKSPFGASHFVSTEGHVTAGARGDDLTNGLVAALESASIDADDTRLVVLDPSQFTLLNGVDSECRTAISVALGLKAPEGWPSDKYWPAPMSVVYASSCVFAAVNTYRRNHAVAAATDYVAWKRVAQIPNVSADKELASEADGEVAKKHDAVRANLRKAYQHIVYLSEGREAMTVRLDKDNQSALDGTVVWKTLADRDKAFDEGDFDKTALLFQLRDEDYGKSLSTIRADFYRSPRLPLLHKGDTDLRNAIYAAIASGEVVITQNGQASVPVRPADINLGSNHITLEKPTAPDPAPSGPSNGQGAQQSDAGATDSDSEQSSTDSSAEASTPTPTTPSPSTVGPAESKVTLSLLGSAFDNPDHRFAARQLFMALADAFDESKVSFGRFQIEVTVAQEVCDEVVEAAEVLGINPLREDL
jgi:hypothetical protein